MSIYFVMDHAILPFNISGNKEIGYHDPKGTAYAIKEIEIIELSSYVVAVYIHVALVE